MKYAVILVLTALLSACGPDRSLLMDTRFDAALRQKVMALASGELTENLSVTGECCEPISGALRQELIDAGADVLTMNGETFTARISSDDIFSLAALDCVTRIRLTP